MGLSNDLISQFVRINNDNSKTKKDDIVYGVVTEVEFDRPSRVQLDGSSERLTPVLSSVNAKVGDRVIISLKNHTATVTGNLTSPSTTIYYVDGIKNDISEAVDTIEGAADKIANLDTLLAKKASVEELYADRARIEDLETDNLKIKKKLTSNEAEFFNLDSDYVTVEEQLNANSADIEELKTNKLDATTANITYATIASLNATNAKVDAIEVGTGKFEQIEAVLADVADLKTDRITATEANAKFANIDFSNIGEVAIRKIFADSGLIENIVVGDGTITGKLVGVTISGDLIEGNTIVAEKLVVKGEDGLYYKLNTDGVTTEAEQTDYNSLNGSVIKAKSITATKISVDDLVAFDATIGGFNITDNSLYSGVKSSAGNTTRGIYLDNEGQMAVGDSSNFIKYYKDSSGNYKLEISADSIIFGAKSKNLEETIDSIEVGGRNLAKGSANNYPNPSFNQFASTVSGVNDYTITDEKYDSMTISKWSGSSTSKWSGPFLGINNRLGATLKVGETYVVSAWMKADVATTINESSLAEGQTVISYQKVVNTDWTRVWTVFTAAEVTKNVCFYTAPNATAEAPYIYMCGIKIEKGNKPTDWTPAPEDLATALEVDTAQTTAEEAEAKASNAETLIAQLKDSISMLVTDGNGTSLMTQTSDGWIFSTAEIQGSVSKVSEDLHSLTQEVGSVGNTVDVLQQAVDDLGVMAEYVKIVTYENEPCIELGESDSDFKLRITNTRMMFTEGSSVLAYFNNQALHIKRAVVEEELQQGGFVWKVRSNGNMGLVWKGGNS